MESLKVSLGVPSSLMWLGRMFTGTWRRQDQPRLGHPMKVWLGNSSPAFLRG